jgi:hypothetical protein
MKNKLTAAAVLVTYRMAYRRLLLYNTTSENYKRHGSS